MHVSAPVATVVAAFIGGAVAFLASVFTKESKTSEFRQAWIDSLREDVSKFISAYHLITHHVESAVAEGNAVNVSVHLERLKAELLLAEQMQASIELRLNPNEHGDVISLIRRLVDADELASADFEQRKEAIEDLVQRVQVILKSEWVRVKKGEPIYRFAKWLSLGVVMVSVVLSFVILN